jgi:hypothetical protein
MRGKFTICCLVGVLCWWTLLHGREEPMALDTDNIPPVGIDWCSYNDIICGDWKPMTVEEEIRYYGEDLGDLLVRIAKCESSLRPEVRGKVDNRDRGLFQINSHYNPQVSDKCAFDIECSTLFTLKEIRAGNLWKWDNSKHCWQSF